MDESVHPQFIDSERFLRLQGTAWYRGLTRAPLAAIAMSVRSMSAVETACPDAKIPLFKALGTCPDCVIALYDCERDERDLLQEMFGGRDGVEASVQHSAAIAVIVLGFVLTPTWAVAGGGQSGGTVTGRFASSYGFAVEIPRGRVAFPQAVVGDHGFIIPLGTQGTESPGRIDFYAAGNVLFWKTANDAAAAWLESLSERALGNITTVVARKDTVVRGVRGVRITASYRDRETGLEMISDQIFLLRSRAGGNRLGDVPDYEYAFGVVSTAQHFDASRRLFESVLATVRFSKREE